MTQKLCNKILATHLSSDNKVNEKARYLLNSLLRDTDRETITGASLGPILELAVKIASTKKNNQQILEKHLLSYISYLPVLRWSAD